MRHSCLTGDPGSRHPSLKGDAPGAKRLGVSRHAPASGWVRIYNDTSTLSLLPRYPASGSIRFARICGWPL